MKSTRFFATIVGALALATASAHALPFSFQFTPPEEPSISSSNETDGPLQSSLPTNFWTATFGCMGSESNAPKTYVMAFLPYDGPSYQTTVLWENDRPSSSPSAVPDGGSTVALLGVTLAGFAALRRRRAARG